MSICRFIASDIPLTEFAPSQDYPVKIDIDKGIVDDGGADDNYFLIPFTDVKDYTVKNYGVFLEWNYTDGRAKQIIEYIRRNNLTKSEFCKMCNITPKTLDDIIYYGKTIDCQKAEKISNTMGIGIYELYCCNNPMNTFLF